MVANRLVARRPKDAGIFDRNGNFADFCLERCSIAPNIE